MKSSTEHVCHQQHLGEKKPKRCRCRKRITLAEATRQVERGFAQWLVISQNTVTVKDVCPICDNSQLKKGCQHCSGTGEIEKSYINKQLGTDIVLVTAGTLESDGSETFRSVKSLKTPRVATIERSHIEKAYLDQNKEEQERIEAYGLLTLQARIDAGIGIEPADDALTRTGRKYDINKCPFVTIKDERTSMGCFSKRLNDGLNNLENSTTEGKE